MQISHNYLLLFLRLQSLHKNLANTNERGKEKSLLFVGFQPFQEGVANDVCDNRNRQLHSQL